MISNFNLFKNNINTQHGHILKNIIESVDDPVCFIGDESTYFFSQVRRINNPSISFTHERVFDFFMLFNNLEKIKFFFRSYHEAFDFLLVEHFERKIFNSKDPIMKSYMLFCLLNLSDNHDDSLSNYNESNVGLLNEKINDMNKYYLNDTKLYLNELPDSNFIISHEKRFTGEGVLITKKKIDGNLMTTIDGFNYYYMEEGGDGRP